MPQTKSAQKRVRQANTKNERNKNRRSKMRTLIKKVLTSTDKALAESAYKDAVSYIDKMSVKGIVHPNNAARKKARLTLFVNKL